jgi:hypothetical protein
VPAAPKDRFEHKKAEMGSLPASTAQLFLAHLKKGQRFTHRTGQIAYNNQFRSTCLLCLVFFNLLVLTVSVLTVTITLPF